MLNDNIVHLREESFKRFNRLWWAQDGTPAYRRIIVRDRLSEVFNHRGIAVTHAIEWLLRSNPM